MTTRDSNQMRALFARLLGGLLALLAAFAAVPSQADAFSYANQKRQIKACVLYGNDHDLPADNDADPDDFAPYTFYILDRSSLKPAGWEFVNPLAPSSVTPSMYQRMQARANGNDPTLNQGQARINAPLTKNLAAYWEVNIDTVAAKDLQQFDIILISVRGSDLPKFTNDAATKLREYVDGGGTLWIDDAGGNGSTGTTNFPVPFGFNSVRQAGTVATLASLHHPLVNYPYPISPIEAQGLGVNPGYYHSGVKPNGDPDTTLVNPRIMVPVVWAGNPNLSRPYVSAGDYGAGHLVISSAGISAGISSFAGGVTLPKYGGNNGAVSGENILAARPVDLKFAYNLIAWTSSVPTGGVNVRRSTATTENIGSQLARKFSTIPVAANANNPGSGAVLYKGVVFFVDGNNKLHAYDANPAADLDNDKNPDDGLPDSVTGASYDEIWNVDLTANGVASGDRVSTPTIVSFYDTANGTPRDLVTVTTSKGVTLAFDAFPIANGKLNTTTTLAWTAQGATGRDMTEGLPQALTDSMLTPSPALSEGVLFTVVRDETNTTAETSWRVAPVDPTTGTSIFDGSAFNGGSNTTVAPSPQIQGGTAGLLSAPVGPLTVGYVRDARTGALDKIVYITCAPVISSANKSAGFVNGIWFSTRNEPLDPVAGSSQQFRPKGARGNVPWYAPTVGGNPDLLPVLHVVTRDPTTGVVTSTTLRYPTDFSVGYSSGAGLNSGTEVTLNQALLANQTLYADYTVDWPGVAVGNPRSLPKPSDLATFATTRGRFTAFTSDLINVQDTFIPGTAALSREGLLYFNVKPPSGGTADRIYGFREQFFANAASNANDPNQLGAQVAWMFSPVDASGLGYTNVGTLQARLINNDPAAGGTGQALTSFQAVGSPAVSNGLVYVVGKVDGGTVILALKANPKMTFSINQRLPVGEQVTLKQPLTTTSTTGQNEITLTENLDFTLERETGTFEILNVRQRPTGDSFNLALPIIVEIGTTRTTVTNPETGYGPLDNLQWFLVIPNAGVPGVITSGLVPASGPSVIGNALYFGTADGRVISVDLVNARAGGQVHLYPNDDPTKDKPRVHEQFTLASATDGTPVAQAIINPPVGTANLVAVGTPQGLAALENQTTLIADGSRLLEVDSAGNAVWELTASRSSRVAGGQLPIYEGGDTPVNGTGATGRIVTQKVTLARPSVAYRYTLNDFIIADTGNNRVLQVDMGGNVTQEIHSLRNDLRFLRPGDPMTLNHPTDVQTFVDNQTGTIELPNTETGISYRYTGPYYAVHHVIADSGNYRIVEVVSIYGPDGNPIVMTSSDGSESVTMLNQVIFVTRSLAEQNARFRYRTVQQFLDPTTNGNNQFYLISAVDNETTGVVNPNITRSVGTDANSNVVGPGGSLVVIYRYPQQADAKDGDLAAVINTIAFVNNGAVVSRQPISNPTWFKQFTVQTNGVNEARYLLADANGVYVLAPQQVNGKIEAAVEWMLSSDDYFRMTGRPLRATCIQRLPQSDYLAATDKFYPHYLITNGYSGPDSLTQVFGASNIVNGEIRGEVVEVRGIDFYNGGYKPLYINDGTTLNRNPNSSIVWMAPNESFQGAGRPLKRSIGSTTDATSTYLFDQPSFADRPF